MIARVEHHHFLWTDTFTNSDKFVIRDTDLDFAGLPFFALLDQYEMVLLDLINRMDWYLNRLGNLLDENPNLGGHTRTDFLRRIQNFDDNQIFLDR